MPACAHGRGSAAGVAACAALALILAGCGAATPAGPPATALSVLAPTDGATVGVHRIDVTGRVAPAGAVVRVSGRRAHVVNGVFRRTILLRRGMTDIPIAATAPGYVTSTIGVSVRYSAGARPHALRDPSTGVGSYGFAARVNAVCAATNTAVRLLPRITSVAILSREFPLMQTLYRRETARLRTLRAPVGQGVLYRDFVNAVAATRRGNLALVTDIQEHRRAALIALLRRQLAATFTNGAKAMALGFEGCIAGATPRG